MLKNNINLCKKKVLVTGAAGFIGSNLVKRICEEYKQAVVIGVDNLNNYYDVSIKNYRLEKLKKYNILHKFVGGYFYFFYNAFPKHLLALFV